MSYPKIGAIPTRQKIGIVYCPVGKIWDEKHEKRLREEYPNIWIFEC